jgi:hypothetical protein
MGPRHSDCIFNLFIYSEATHATSPPCLKAKANKPHLPPSESAERSAREETAGGLSVSKVQKRTEVDRVRLSRGTEGESRNIVSHRWGKIGRARYDMVTVFLPYSSTGKILKIKSIMDMNILLPIYH